MTRQFRFFRRPVSGHCTAPAQATRAWPVEATRRVDAATTLRKVFQTLPVPALLLDRTGTVQVVNAEASTLFGPSAIGDHLGHCFVADRADANHADQGTTMTRLGPAPVATCLSGRVRLADSHWVAAQLRFERAPGLRHGHSDADVIALVHLQPQATQEIVPASSTVN